jgi:hypothetical protein
MLDRSALIAVLALPFLSAPAPRAEIRFAPAPGLALRKTFESSAKQQLESMSVTFNGEEQEQEQEHQTSTETRLVVIDRYVARDEERVTKLERSFDEFALEAVQEIEAGGEEHKFQGEATNELTGSTVQFTWDAKAQDYVASAKEGELESEWLEELQFELDFRALLPRGEVAVGDEWEVDAEALRAMLRIDRQLPLDWTRSFDGEEQEQSEEEEEPDEKESTDGELVARFEGLREVDGLELAVIRLAGEYETTSSAERSVESEQGTQSTVSQTTISVEIEGECLWNLAGGHFHSCALEAQTSSTTEADITADFMGQSMAFSQQSTTAGGMSFRARFESAE